MSRGRHCRHLEFHRNQDCIVGPPFIAERTSGRPRRHRLPEVCRVPLGQVNIRHWAFRGLPVFREHYKTRVFRVSKLRYSGHMDTLTSHSTEARIRQLEDDLKAAERRAEEARRERDEAHKLVTRMQEQVKDANAIIERWIEAFNMRRDDGGRWSSEHIIDQYRELAEKYGELLKKWNTHVPRWNAHMAPRPVGRPVGASEAQIKTVISLHRKGVSIRGIADETSLGVRTVRTILGREDWTDRTSQKWLEKINYKPVRAALMTARSRKRTRDALLSKGIAETLKAGTELLKEAKGIK
jgi:hypothetical protein